MEIRGEGFGYRQQASRNETFAYSANEWYFKAMDTSVAGLSGARSRVQPPLEPGGTLGRGQGGVQVVILQKSLDLAQTEAAALLDLLASVPVLPFGVGERVDILA